MRSLFIKSNEKSLSYCQSRRGALESIKNRKPNTKPSKPKIYTGQFSKRPGDRHYFSRQTKVFQFRTRSKATGNQKQRLRQEIPCLCRQPAHCFVQYYRQIICIAFCKLRRNFRFFCSVNHLSGPLRQQMFISKSSKGHGL